MIAGYIQVNLKNMLTELGEDRVKSILSEFSCPLNIDVETFLKQRAVEFAKQGIAATHLVFASYKQQAVLVGYFTITSKFIIIHKGSTSNALQKKIAKFAQKDTLLKRYSMSVPLIAQLGKNYADNRNQMISGDELLKLACEKVHEIQLNLGGRFVYLECEEKERLLEFYRNNGFVNFGRRSLDKDEEEIMHGKYLIQMLRYLK